MEQVIRNIIKDIGLQDWNPKIQLIAIELIFKYFTTKYISTGNLANYANYIGVNLNTESEFIRTIIAMHLENSYLVSDSSENGLQKFVISYDNKFFAAEFGLDSYGADFNAPFNQFKQVFPKDRTITVYE